jgi:glutathione S-transferase
MAACRRGRTSGRIATKILVGQYDSPFVRRVAVSLRTLGFAYVHDTRSVLRTSMRSGRSTRSAASPRSCWTGEVLIDSAAILDWLDGEVGPARALMPASGVQRRRTLRLIALATGAIDKIGAATYERVVRPAAFRWPEWVQRCRTQGQGAIAALAAEPWPAGAPLDQAQITTACMIRYVRMADPEALPPGRHPSLDGLSERCETLPAFQATFPAEYAIPRSA